MPELPEVETTARGIAPHIESTQINQVIVRQKQLRWPISSKLKSWINGQNIHSVERRAKYILIHFDEYFLMIHLGMSGSLRIANQSDEIEKHAHIDLILSNNKILRYRDPRRFGFFLHSRQPRVAKLLEHLGPEPLSRDFNAKNLFNSVHKRKTAIKSLLMNQHIVVGIGNIYAAETLFQAGIHPLKPASTIDLDDCKKIVQAAKKIIRQAIKAGGTTLKDFSNSDGKPGYFQQKLWVYGREGEACYQCQTLLESIKINQRASVFCPRCQP